MSIDLKRPNDIKAPDGFLLGGERKVRQGGIILFHRSWWKVPEEWSGEYCWVHVADCWATEVEVAPPGFSSIYRAQMDRATIQAERVRRDDAKPTRPKRSTPRLVGSFP